MDVCLLACVVEERSYLHWRWIARFAGALGSENVGMSNHKAGENPAHRKSKVSWATVIVPGLVGPKPRQCSVGDGQRVNIPVLVWVCAQMRGMIAGADSWLYPSKRLNGREWKFRKKWFLSKCWLEKSAYAWLTLSVPQTDTGAQVEKTKVYEWFFAKELGNTATVTSE